MSKNGSKKWSDPEVAKLTKLLEKGTPNRQIAKSLKRSVKAVERKIEGLGLKRPPEALTEEVTREHHWRDEARRLAKELKKSKKRNIATEVLVEEIQSIAPVRYSPAPKIKWPKKSAGSAQSAVLLLSDTHIGQVVQPDQTLGFGKYDFNTFLYRLKRLETTVHSILSDHVSTEVPELVVAMLGDMLHGALNHAEEAGQRNVLFSQMYGAGHALAQFLRNLSTLVPKIRIYTTVGNHTRYANQHKMPSKNRFSNFDQFLYAYTKALTGDLKNVEWNLTQQPFAVFTVQGYKFFASHGEELRGGDKMLGVPIHAMGRRISSTCQMMASQDQKPVNYFVFGHHHKPMSIPHTMGEMLCNGCFAGLDDFSLSAGYNPIDPIQKFMLVHPKFGRAATYDLHLDLAANSGKLPYEIPVDFPVE
ncbi:MAG: metallophosphoesterase [Planctomycetota bacterium]|jgi:hypothetical protein